jgi:hypothetical protein
MSRALSNRAPWWSRGKYPKKMRTYQRRAERERVRARIVDRLAEFGILPYFLLALTIEPVRHGDSKRTRKARAWERQCHLARSLKEPASLSRATTEP